MTRGRIWDNPAEPGGQAISRRIVSGSAFGKRFFRSRGSLPTTWLRSLKSGTIPGAAEAGCDYPRRIHFIDAPQDSFFPVGDRSQRMEQVRVLRIRQGKMGMGQDTSDPLHGYVAFPQNRRCVIRQPESVARSIKRHAVPCPRWREGGTPDPRAGGRGLRVGGPGRSRRGKGRSRWRRRGRGR